MTTKWHDLTEGSELQGPVRKLTMRRINWYGSGIWTMCTDELQEVKPNIHTDVEYARSEGLPNAIGDGMTATNWCSEMLVEYFGLHYLARPHKLRTKFIKPTELDAVVSVRGKVTGVDITSDGDRVFSLDIWTEDAAGTKLTDGDATVSVPATA